MANWGDYSSLIQLGAALNFAYAGLEVILSKPLQIVTTEHKNFIEGIFERAKQKRPALSGPPGAYGYSQASHVIGLAQFADACISRLNPYLAVTSGVLATLMLGHGSEVSETIIGTPWKIAAWVVGYGWFFVTLVWMGLCRLGLAIVAKPALAGGRRGGDG
jgi:hypothetical protein